MIKVFLFTLFAASFVQAAQPETKALGWNLLGKVYDLDSSTTLFDYSRKETIEGNVTRVEKIYKGTDGKVAVFEQLTYKDDKLVEHIQHHKQVGAEARMEVKNGKLLFSYTQDGKTKTSEETIDGDDFVVSTDEIYPFLVSNMKKLDAGETLNIRLPVLNRLETVGFKYYKADELTKDGKKIVSVKMKPSSFVIALLVKPLFFKIEKEAPYKLDEVVGRTLPKIEKNGKWKDLDAILRIDYKSMGL